MKEAKLSCFLLLFFILAGTCCAVPPQTGPQDSEKSCLRFTQDFYNWYIANAHSAENSAPWHAALKYKGNPLGSRLTSALKQSDDERKTEDDPVLDFDPILNSQDPADHYEVRSVTRKNGHYWAKVYGIWSRNVADQGKQPQVIAEIIFKNGRWIFVNFHYPNSTNPDNENLLSILKYQYHPK